MFGLPELYAAIRQFCVDNLPGRTPLRIRIYTAEDGKEALSIPIVGAPTPQPNQGAATRSSASERQSTRAKRCIEAILKILTDSGRPMTGESIKEELARAGKELSGRWVDEILARMIRLGLIENPRDERPRGYRLVETEQP